MAGDQGSEISFVYPGKLPSEVFFLLLFFGLFGVLQAGLKVRKSYSVMFQFFLFYFFKCASSLTQTGYSVAPPHPWALIGQQMKVRLELFNIDLQEFGRQKPCRAGFGSQRSSEDHRMILRIFVSILIGSVSGSGFLAGGGG